MTTESAPRGNTPPVKIRTAWLAPNHPGKRFSGGDSGHQGETVLRRPQIGRPHRVAILRRVVMRRHIEQSALVACQHPTQGTTDRHLPPTIDRFNRFQQPVPRVVDTQRPLWIELCHVDIHYFAFGKNNCCPLIL
jgi:hypothetical protein